jgi:hypothetical protein
MADQQPGGTAVQPATLEEAARFVAESRQTVIGRNGLDLSRLAGPVEINAENLSATFLAGTRLADLQRLLAPHGLWWPLDAAPDRTLGAVLATAGPFPSRTAYGRASDWVLGLEVILAGGEQMRLGGQTVKDVAGYDLVRLIVGSRGTLGAIGAATLRLLPLPERQVTVSLPRSGWRCAIDLAVACEWDGTDLLVRLDGRPSQVERRLAALNGRLTGAGLGPAVPASAEPVAGPWARWYAVSRGRCVRRSDPDWSLPGAPLLGLWRTAEPYRFTPLEEQLRAAIAPGRCFNPHL